METAPNIPLSRRADGRLVLRHTNDKGESVDTPVQIACAFPWSRPGEFVSIRDDKGKELQLVERLTDIDEAGRSLIEQELASRNFIPTITRIDAVESQLELFHWVVMTDAGLRSFLTNRHDYPRTVSEGKVLIKDVGNDLYIINNPKSLDAKSLKLLWVHLD